MNGSFSGSNAGFMSTESSNGLFDRYARLKGGHYPATYNEARQIMEERGVAALTRAVEIMEECKL